MKKEIGKELQILQDKLIASEAKFKLLFEKAPLAYQSLDINGDLLEVNEMWLTTLGYTREEVIGRNLSEFLTPEWKIHFYERFPKFKNIGEILGHEFEFIKKTGEVILVSVQGRIGLNDLGEFKQTHCIFSDITLFREAENRNIQLRKELIQSKKREAVGRFAREIIHDLNNILTPLIFSTEVLEKNIDKESENYIWIEKIKTSIDRAKELIEEIHSFSKPTDDNSFNFVVMQPVIKEVLDLIKAPDNIKLVTDIDDFDYGMCGTPIKLHKILMNLITNAIHAIEPNDGTVTVKLKLLTIQDNNIYIPNAPAGLYSCLTIKDDGCGISQENIDKIFDPFFTTRQDGTGLGLSMVDNLIKALRGFICVNSEEGVGTKIRVYLPMKPAGIFI